jgi:hypothetical protein
MSCNEEVAAPVEIIGDAVNRVDPGSASLRENPGRPQKISDTKRIAALRAKAVGWKRIAAEMGVGVGTIYRVTLDGSEIREKVF